MSGEREIVLPFGRRGLAVKLPTRARTTMIRKTPLKAVRDTYTAIREALDHPINSAPLRSLARSRRSACILICDITRPVPNHLFLRSIIEDLMASGVACDAICVLVATGLHRPNEGAELAELVRDPWVLANVRVENHFARKDADHVDLGVTPTRGIAVKLDRRFVEAELRIVTGLVEPHFMAGYSGGRKVIAPGIAHADTIQRLHSARFLEDPMSRVGNLQSNPLHEEQLEIVKMVGEVYALNTVLNEDRELVHVTFGEIIASHEAAVEFARNSCVVKVGRQFSTIVTSSAGYPLDTTYYQTVKGMVTPLDILKPGGALIIASECLEGIGSTEFQTAQRLLLRVGPEAFAQTLKEKRLADIDEWQSLMLVRAMRQGRLQLYSEGLDNEGRQLVAVECIDSIEEAIAQSIERSNDPDVAVIPEGPYIVPLRGMD